MSYMKNRMKKYLLDPDCADEVIPIMDPGAKARLVLWPKEGLGPAETIEVECTWERPFPLLRVSDYYCAAKIDGVDYAFWLYSLAWPANKQVGEEGRTRQSVEREKQQASTGPVDPATICPDPPKHKTYEVFRIEG